MNLFFNKKFLHELSKLPNDTRKQIEILVFASMKKHKSLHEIPDIKKLKGYKNYYRIRFGSYRLGISYTNDTVTFERVLHRKDIYKFFP